MRTYKIITDAAVKNVGEAIRYRGTAGVLVLNEDDTVVKFDSFTLGKVTNNEGEYEALDRGILIVDKHLRDLIDAASELEGTSVNLRRNTAIQLFTDSDLVYNQLLGNHKINKIALKEKAKSIKVHVKDFKHVNVNWHPRDQPLAVLADFASKHTKKTKKLHHACVGHNVSMLEIKVEEYLEKMKEKQQEKEANTNEQATD